MPASKLEIMGPLTTAERNALVTNGNMPPYTVIFNSSGSRFEYWDGSAWNLIPWNNPVFTGLTVNDVVANINEGLTIGGQWISMNSATLATTQGSDVASANDLNLNSGGNVFPITGATQINAITNQVGALDGRISKQGMVVTLIFASTPTVKHNTSGGAGTSPILLAGAVDFVASAGDTLTLVNSDLGGVGAWREIGRAVI